MILYEREDDALAASGEIYRHHKGGIYRLIARDVRHSETGEEGVVYEHLWPHTHQLWYRPDTPAGFFGTLPDGSARFQKVKDA